MNDLEERIRRSFDEPARSVDVDDLLGDVRRGAARRRTRRIASTAVAVAAAVVVVVGAVGLLGGSRIAPIPPEPQPVGLPSPTVEPPKGNASGTSGIAALPDGGAVRITQEWCRGQMCSLFWTQDGDGWVPRQYVRWAGTAGEGMVVGPVSAIRMAGNGHDGWAWGDQVWSTHDGGTSWSRVGGTTSFGPIVATDTTAFAPDRDGGRLLTTGVSQDRWRELSLPATPAMQGPVSDSVAATARRIVLAGLDPRLGAGVLVSDDDLATAQFLKLPEEAESLDTYHVAASAHTIYAVSLTDGSASLWTSDGRTWSRMWQWGVTNQLVAAVVPRGDAGAVVSFDQGPTYVVGANGVEQSPIGGGRSDVITGSFRDPEHGWVVAQRPVRLLHTDDGGRTWH